MVRMRCAVLAALLIGLAAPLGRAHDADAEARVLAVQGEGEVTAPADIATVRIGVTAENERAAAAQGQVNEVAGKILAAVQKLKIEDRDVQTVELQIGPVYANDPQGTGVPRIRAYQASNVVRVTVRDLAKLGTIVDAALGAGGNRVDGVEFALRDDREARKEALRRAVADGRAKATALSEALGVKLGPVRSLREGGGSGEGPVPFPRMKVMVADSASTQASPGEISVRAQVSLEYALE